MGRRVADGESVVAIDLPVELGYQCPIHKRDIMDTDLYGPPVLQWSEWPWPCSTERLHRLAEGEHRCLTPCPSTRPGRSPPTRSKATGPRAPSTRAAGCVPRRRAGVVRARPGEWLIARAVARHRSHAELWNDTRGRTEAEVLEWLRSADPITPVELADVFGSLVEPICALVLRAARLTSDEAQRLKAAAGVPARDAAWDAARDAAGAPPGDAARTPPGTPPGDAAGDAAWAPPGTPQGAAWDAARRSSSATSSAGTGSPRSTTTRSPGGRR